jgi:hypothetical protein
LKKALQINNHGCLATPLGWWISTNSYSTWPSWYALELITLSEAQTKLAAETQWAVEWIEQIGDTAIIAQGLGTSHTIAAADGSFKDLCGTSEFALVHKPTGQRINGANQVPGEETDQASSIAVRWPVSTEYYSWHKCYVGSTVLPLDI